MRRAREVLDDGREEGEGRGAREDKLSLEKRRYQGEEERRAVRYAR